MIITWLDMWRRVITAHATNIHCRNWVIVHSDSNAVNDAVAVTMLHVSDASAQEHSEKCNQNENNTLH